MDIRPHRRLVVPFEPPYFSDPVSVSEFVADHSDRFGVAKFSASLFSYTTIPILRKMCDSLGLKLMIDCSLFDQDTVDRALASTVDYVIVSVAGMTDRLPGRARRLVRISGPQDAIMASLHPVSGVACDGSFVAEAKSGLQGDPFILCLDGDVVAAIKNGASAAVVDVAAILASPKPEDAFRDLAEAVREHT